MLLFMIILLFNPKILYRFVQNKPAQINIFIDNSASMGWQSEKENRPLELANNLKSLETILKENDVSVKRYTFNSSVQPDSSNNTDQNFLGLTDFNALVKFISNSQSDISIVLSDGIRTDGPLPQLNNLPIVYTIGIGNTKAEPDLNIVNVESIIKQF